MNSPYLKHIVLLSVLTISNLNLLHAGRKPKTKELGLMGGFMYYSGDLNPEGHLNTQFYHLSFSGYYRKNYNTRVSTRWMLLRGKVSGDDSYFDNTFQTRRNLNFYSSITELSSTIEFNFFAFSALKERSERFSPYLFVGLGAFYFNPKQDVNGTKLDLKSQSNEGVDYSKFSVAIPFGTGIKLRFSNRFFMTMEYGMRKTFTDFIDDVSTVYPKSLYQRGNSKQKDWYQYLGLSLSFRIGEKFIDCPSVD